MFVNSMLLTRGCVSGMKVAYKIFPEGFLTGSPPLTVTETPRSTPRTERADRDKFTHDDLEKLGIYLDNALCDKSSGSKTFSSGYLGCYMPLPPFTQLTCRLYKDHSKSYILKQKRCFTNYVTYLTFMTNKCMWRS